MSCHIFLAFYLNHIRSAAYIMSHLPLQVFDTEEGGKVGKWEDNKIDLRIYRSKQRCADLVEALSLCTRVR